MYAFDERYCIDQFQRLLAIDSTTGQFRQIQNYIEEELTRLGFPWEETRKGGVIATLGGNEEPIVVTAHLDDIGLMVRRVNGDGTLNVCPVGGLHPFYSVMENVRVYTRDGRVYSGTICRTPNSIHVTEEELRLTLGDYRKNVCIVLDEPVGSAAETRALGIETGDIVALEPRFVYSNGYLKSRFVDDKACVAVLLTAMKYIRDNGLALRRKVYAYFSVYEEIGHGTSWVPEDTEDILALDIAPTGPDQTSDERKVTIFAKDASFPYHWEMGCQLREAAIRAGVDYVVDIFTPHYGSDGNTTVRAGYDVRHGGIGPGTSNSHGYERTHIDGLRNTYALLLAYLEAEEAAEAPADWNGETLARMKSGRITGRMLAEESGYTPTYLSAVLNGKKGTAQTREKISQALDRLEKGKPGSRR